MGEIWISLRIMSLGYKGRDYWESVVFLFFSPGRQNLGCVPTACLTSSRLTSIWRELMRLLLSNFWLPAPEDLSLGCVVRRSVLCYVGRWLELKLAHIYDFKFGNEVAGSQSALHLENSVETIWPVVSLLWVGEFLNEMLFLMTNMRPATYDKDEISP